jgi:hypothetical protein
MPEKQLQQLSEKILFASSIEEILGELSTC